MSYGKRGRLRWRIGHQGKQSPHPSPKMKRDAWESRGAVADELWRRVNDTAHDPEQKDDDNERRPSNSN